MYIVNESAPNALASVVRRRRRANNRKNNRLRKSLLKHNESCQINNVHLKNLKIKNFSNTI